MDGKYTQSEFGKSWLNAWESQKLSKDLPRKEIGIDIENDFSMVEDVLEDKKDFVNSSCAYLHAIKFESMERSLS